MNDEEIKKIVKENSSGNRLNCAQAFAIAQKHDIPINKIGEICNLLEIKVHNCQLGCFK